ncbi:MAG: peptide deformylase [Candidatus Margulisiibacteriota bacterium]
MELQIITNPNPILRKKAKSVRRITPEIKKLVKDMAETLYKAPGVGLAANQVAKLLRIVVIDISEDRDSLIVLINPKYTYKSKEKKVLAEGCLSVPGYEGQVERHVTVRIKTMNVEGELEANGYLAQAIQHEMDHLDGILYIDCLYGDTGLRRLDPKTPVE